MRYIDFSRVKPEHESIHKRLTNWGAWCKDSKGNTIAPMFRSYKSKWRQWHEPEIREVIDGIDAQRIQKLMVSLPIEQRKVLAWYYTSNKSPLAASKKLEVNQEELMEVLTLARDSINNHITC